MGNNERGIAATPRSFYLLIQLFEDITIEEVNDVNAQPIT